MSFLFAYVKNFSYVCKVKKINMSKARDIIPKIIKSSNKSEALVVLNDILEALHLSESYTNLIKIRDNFSEKKQEYVDITDEYNSSPQTIEDMLEARKYLNFLYRDISDQFSYIINKNKILFEEEKTSVRAESMKRLKEDATVQEMFKTKSTSGLRDIVGLDDGYKEYIANASISYGLYQELNSILTSIRMFIDFLASSIRAEQLINEKDIK